MLRALAAVDAVPHPLARGRGFLLRSWIEGSALQDGPTTNPRWFEDAMQLVRRMHAAGVAHNDLHKEPNWLVRSDGGPAIVDFQLATLVRWPRWWLRLLEREDERHLLEHKRRYCAAALTDGERTHLARAPWTTRLRRVTGKKVYNLVTRRLLRWSDREGRGSRRSRREGPPA